jgi:hypothetical protein
VLSLGQILLEEKALTAQALEEGMAAQVIHGGRLGTNLVELGLISEEQLAAALARQHGVISAFGEIKPEPAALALLDPAFADDKDVLPFRLEGNRLHLLVITPGDIAAIDHVAEVTGKRVIPTVIPEFRMAQLLRRHCKAWRPVRAIDVAGPARVKKQESAAEKPVATDLISEDEFQTLYARAITGGGEDTLPEIEVVEEEPEPQPRVLPIEQVLSPPPPPTAAPAPLKRRRPALVAADAKPLSFSEAQAHLSKTSDRDDVARTVLQFALGVFRRALLLKVQGNIALGWQGVGPSTRERAPFVAVPLSKPSTFKLVFDTRSHFIGPLRRDAATQAFMKVLRIGEPKTAVLMPILARGRVVNILYGDNGPGELASPDLGELLILAQHVGRSYEELIAQRKRAGSFS